MDTIVAPRKIIRLEEFLQWDSGDGLRYELVDGVPEPMAPTANVHGLILAELAFQITLHLRTTGSPCAAAVAPGLIPYLVGDWNYRIPDLAVTCTRPTQSEHALAGPVVTCEILSPGNRSETRRNLAHYATLPTVQDIVLIDCLAIHAEIASRLPDATWPKEFHKITEGTLTLPSIGFSTPLDSLYRFTPLAR